MSNQVAQNLLLNLGPFDECIELLRDGVVAEYPCDFYGDAIFIVERNRSLHQIIDSSNNSITVPTFDVEVFAEVEDSGGNRDLLVGYLSRYILQMIFSHFQECSELSNCVKNNSVAIPLRRDIGFVHDGKNLRASVEIGFLYGLRSKELTK
jgi:hypothetical protein